MVLPMPEQFARTSPPKYSGEKRSQFAAGEAKRCCTDRIHNAGGSLILTHCNYSGDGIGETGWPMNN
jgi:hypothetical protein